MFKALIDWFNRADSIVNPPHEWPDIQRKFEDSKRPGLVFTVPPAHIFLCPFEIERLKQDYDKKLTDERAA